MSNLDFAWPYAALLLLLLFPMWVFEKRRDHGFLTNPKTALIKHLMKVGIKPTWSRAINWFWFFCFALLVLALMRPQYVGDPVSITRSGRNIMLVVDISESMEAEDMILLNQPMDRLTAAKKVLREFIDRRSGDRIGLVVFGSESFLHAPLSFDHPVIKQFLDEAQIGFAGPKTAIGDAIGLAVKKLMETEGEKTMILLTDGQNNMGSLEPLKAAEIAQKYDVKIYIVGLGSSRMMVNGFFGPTAINPSISLDEAEPELKEIAAMTKGKYFRAREYHALEAIYKDIDQLEPVVSDPVILIPHKELFYWPLACFLIISLIKFLWLWRTSQAIMHSRTNAKILSENAP
jgi:Ca-activated chloride channel homolog